VKAPAFLAPLLHGDVASCVLVDQRGRTIASRVRAAFDSASRRKGLLGRERLDEGEAIVIAPCNAVHTFFMRFPIDVVHVDREGRVLRVKHGLRPWRIDACLGGFAVIELPAGTVARFDVRRTGILQVVTPAVSGNPSPSSMVTGLVLKTSTDQ
jgi:uncharacterized protein